MHTRKALCQLNYTPSLSKVISNFTLQMHGIWSMCNEKNAVEEVANCGVGAQHGQALKPVSLKAWCFQVRYPGWEWTHGAPTRAMCIKCYENRMRGRKPSTGNGTWAEAWRPTKECTGQDRRYFSITTIPGKMDLSKKTRKRRLEGDVMTRPTRAWLGCIYFLKKCRK